MSKTKVDLKRANLLMKELAQLTANKKRLDDSIANERKAYVDGIKEREKELLEMAEVNGDEFNVEGNWVLDNGYVHIATNTVVVTSKKFDAKEFAKAYPDYIDMSKAMKTSLIKKAFLNDDDRKDLKAFGVSLNTEKNLQVIPMLTTL